jgi:hypothetical protein
MGLTSERWYLQRELPPPYEAHAELFILTLEGDPAGAIQKLGASDHPFDQWFKEQARAVHGVDFNQPLPGPPPELIFEGWVSQT